MSILGGILDYLLNIIMETGMKLMSLMLFFLWNVMLNSEILKTGIFEFQDQYHGGEKHMEVLHAESQFLQGENTICHQEMVVILLKIGKGK